MNACSMISFRDFCTREKLKLFFHSIVFLIELESIIGLYDFPTIKNLHWNFSDSTILAFFSL